MNTQDNNRPDLAQEMGNTGSAVSSETINGFQSSGERIFLEVLNRLNNMNMSSIATGARETVLEKAPHVLDIFRTAAVEWPKLADKLRSLSISISVEASRDYKSAQTLVKESTAELLGEEFIQQVDSSIVAKFLLDLAGQLSDMADFAREELDKFCKNQPGVIAAFLSFSAIAYLKPHEFLSGLTIDSRKPNMTDSGDYSASLFAALMFNRADFIKAINFKVSNNLTCAIIENRYIEIGGEQHALEATGQSCMEKSSSEIAEMPLCQTKTAIDEAFEKISNLLTTQQRQEIELLRSKARLEELVKPISLDTPICENDQDTGTLGDVIPAGQDMDTAIETYYSAVSTLPADMQPVFRRLIEKRESPKQAALNLGFEWTTALERRLERMKEKIYKQML